MNLKNSAAMVVCFWIAAVALTNTASQAMQPMNEVTVAHDQLIAAIFPTPVECTADCALGVLPAVVDLVSLLVDGPIHFGPTFSDGCIVVLEIPLATPPRDTPRKSTDIWKRRHWSLCLVGNPGILANSTRAV